MTDGRPEILKKRPRICNAGCDKNVPGTNCCLYDLCNDFLCYCSDTTFAKIIQPLNNTIRTIQPKKPAKTVYCAPFQIHQLTPMVIRIFAPEDYGEDNYYDNGLFPCEIFNSDCATCKHEYWRKSHMGQHTGISIGRKTMDAKEFLKCFITIL